MKARLISKLIAMMLMMMLRKMAREKGVQRMTSKRSDGQSVVAPSEAVESAPARRLQADRPPTPNANDWSIRDCYYYSKTLRSKTRYVQ
jgi:hypothetical protein